MANVTGVCQTAMVFANMQMEVSMKGFGWMASPKVMVKRHLMMGRCTKELGMRVELKEMVSRSYQTAQCSREIGMITYFSKVNANSQMDRYMTVSGKMVNLRDSV